MALIKFHKRENFTSQVCGVFVIDYLASIVACKDGRPYSCFRFRFLFLERGRSGDINAPRGGPDCSAHLITDTHDKSDAMLNAAQHVSVVLAHSLVFHIPHRRNKPWPVLNHCKGGLLGMACLRLFI